MCASQTYERPALRKAFAAFAADSKVANASLAVIAIVVSTSDKLPPPAAASTAEAAAFASGNSPMASKCQIPRDELTSYASLATASSRFSGLASMLLTASDVNRPREMKIGMASLLEILRVLVRMKKWPPVSRLPPCGNSADVRRPPLGFELNDSLWLRRQLKNRSLLTLAQ
jgi:hypothetical protein